MTGTDEKYVKRGQDLVIRHDPGWEDDLKMANRGKTGAPFLYANALIMLAAALRVAYSIPYRQLEGTMLGMLAGHSVPDHTTLSRRINLLDVKINDGTTVVTDKERRIMMAVDATGLKQHNCSAWIRQKWKVRRGFVKLHILADTRTKKILAAVVTDDSVGDSKMFNELLTKAVGSIGPDDGPCEPGCTNTSHDHYDDYPENPSMEREPLAYGISPLAGLGAADGDARADPIVLADAAYSSRANVALCKKLGVEPRIMHRISSTAAGKGSGDAWGQSVRHQFGGSTTERIGTLTQDEKRENQTYWKLVVRYGQRWIVEAIFSAFKRMFGESLMSLTWDNMVQEVKLKLALYNRWVDMAHGA